MFLFIFKKCTPLIHVQYTPIQTISNINRHDIVCQRERKEPLCSARWNSTNQLNFNTVNLPNRWGGLSQATIYEFITCFVSPHSPFYSKARPSQCQCYWQYCCYPSICLEVWKCLYVLGWLGVDIWAWINQGIVDACPWWAAEIEGTKEERGRKVVSRSQWNKWDPVRVGERGRGYGEREGREGGRSGKDSRQQDLYQWSEVKVFQGRLWRWKVTEYHCESIKGVVLIN